MVVYLVGAGPGDPELLTLKAKRLIENAEVIIYDRLVNEEIINWAPFDSQLIYVGKREHDSRTSQQIQSEIHDIITKFGPNKRVVRLKGGDPFIFGRGGEEALICSNAGIKFEVVPGISSFYAVPAYAGIPVSHREFNSVFAVLTGHESVKLKSAIDWSKLPETLIILMGVSKIQNIAKNLLEVGRNPLTPVAAIKWGTTYKQKTIMTNLKELAEDVEDLSPPIVFVIGKITSLHSKLNWFEEKISKIRGKKVVLARARTHMNESKKILDSYGFKPIMMPLIDIVSRDFTIPNLADFDALVFTSVEGVKRAGEKVDLASFEGRTFSIGPKTNDLLLKKYSLKSKFGEHYNSEGLAHIILSELKQGSKVLLLRSSSASKTLKEMLSTKFDVTEKYVYDIKQLSADPELIAGADAIFVMSASCAKSLERLEKTSFEKIKVVSIGPETSRFLTMPHITATEFTLKGMIREYLNYIWSD